MNLRNVTKLMLILLISTAATGVLTAEKGESSPLKSKRKEAVEWCKIWVDSARENDKPRVLLIGDSITCGYYFTAVKYLKGKAYCTQFGTSVCVADPTFYKQLEAVLCGYKYDVIHFNNGLHEFGYTSNEYQESYEKALKYIKEKSPSAKIILVLSTPLKTGSGTAKKYQKNVNERNDVVRYLAKKYGLKINDLHSISKDHPEYYRDPYHYKAKAVDLQGKQVAEIIMKSLQEK
jgi:lysophospholipase L1-like esterase